MDTTLRRFAHLAVFTPDGMLPPCVSPGTSPLSKPRLTCRNRRARLWEWWRWTAACPGPGTWRRTGSGGWAPGEGSAAWLEERRAGSVWILGLAVFLHLTARFWFRAKLNMFQVYARKWHARGDNNNIWRLNLCRGPENCIQALRLQLRFQLPANTLFGLPHIWKGTVTSQRAAFHSCVF